MNHSYTGGFQEHLNIIRKQLADRRAVLFVGAGLSLNAEAKHSQVQSRFKAWNELITQLGGRLWPNLSEKELAERVCGNHLLVAQWYQDEFGLEAFYHELIAAIPYKDYKPGQVHRELLSLPWQDIITTNQDRLIEETLEELYVPYDVVLDDLDIPVKSQSHKVYKIHFSHRSMVKGREEGTSR